MNKNNFLQSIMKVFYQENSPVLLVEIQLKNKINIVINSYKHSKKGACFTHLTISLFEWKKKILLKA